MNRRVLWLGLLASGVVLAAIIAVAYQRSRPAALTIQPQEPAGAAPRASAARQIQDFALTDSQGLELDTRELRGQVWVASFFFSSCPSICRQQNEHLRQLWRQFGQQGVRFVSITCDPEVDTPQRLMEYAKLYEADPDEWFFLTGDLERISQIGEESFQLGVGYRTHSDRFVAVDKWGWVRGIYDWHDPRQLEELQAQLELLLLEDSSPYATPQPAEAATGRGTPLLHDFTLTDSSGQEFSSQDWLGQVWVASFFFTTCPSTCRAQNDVVSHLQREFGSDGVRFLGITCDPQTDTPARLDDYARLYGADGRRWRFVTGDLTLIRRIGAERFQVPVDLRAHVDRLIVVDRAGQTRGKFDWHDAAQMAQLKELLAQLVQTPEGLIGS